MKKGSCLPNIFSQVIYSGGYSDGEPPLPIPNREAKPVIADGTARPGGRVGSRRAWKESSDERSSGDSFSCLWVCEGTHPLPTPYVHAGIVVDCPYARTMFECILVLSLSYLYVHAGIAVGCPCCRCMFESVLVMRLSTPPVHAGVAAACPCGRTLQSCSDVFPCGTAVRGLWTGVFVMVVPALCPRV